MISNLLNIIFPPRCAICGELLKIKEHGACSLCRSSLTPIDEPLCKTCGKPIEMAEDEYCFDCGRMSREFDLGLALWPYHGQMKKSIATYKYAGCRDHRAFYVDQMITHLGERIVRLQADGFVPVPLFRAKQRARGFNQAEHLAEGLSEALHIPVYDHVLLRKRNTAPQKGLSHKERQVNLKHAFQVDTSLYQKLGSPKTLIIVDDIFTTGNTMDECARVLKQAGVKKIYFVCLCIGKDF